MQRILGIDFGTRRIGLALSDESQKLAFPYGVLDIQKKAASEVIAELKDICKKEMVGEIVLGLPRGLARMQDTEMTLRARAFARTLEAMGIPVHLHDEFFSTKEARGAPRQYGHVDASAAAIILQSFLDRQKDVLH